MTEKPLGIKAYGQIPHVPDSRLGPSDKQANPGHVHIATVKPRDHHDQIFVQEKLDGSNCAVALLNGEIIPLIRAGYRAITSPYEQHHRFAAWVYQNLYRFQTVLREGERVIGEWLAQAHGTRYFLSHEPFVIFDLMVGTTRTPYDELVQRVEPGAFTTPFLLHRGSSCSVAQMLALLGTYGYHGALDPAEGAVWRIERKGKVDFLCKYVRPDKVNGNYLPELSGQPPVWNELVKSTSHKKGK